jgi:hypothetical protein
VLVHVRLLGGDSNERGCHRRGDAMNAMSRASCAAEGNRAADGADALCRASPPRRHRLSDKRARDEAYLDGEAPFNEEEAALVGDPSHARHVLNAALRRGIRPNTLVPAARWLELSPDLRGPIRVAIASNAARDRM